MTITVAEAPATVTSCNCSTCRRLGALWSYYRPSEVTVTGTTVPYIWGDRMLARHFCPVCSCTTHWEDIREAPSDRMGVNARLLDMSLDGIPITLVDGASY